MSETRVRFAPSPTGKVHIGNIRAALPEDMTLEAFWEHLKKTLSAGGFRQEELSREDLEAVKALKLQIVEEAQLNANAGIGAAPWFMVADTTYAKSIQVDYLNGKDIPTIRRMETPGQLGFVWDIFLDWGITVMDPRGINMNPGEPLVL